MVDNKVLALGAIVILAFAAMIYTAIGLANLQPIVPNSPTPTPTAIASTPTPIQLAVVQNGDLVYVDYILTLDNGTIKDTSIKSVAVANGIFNEMNEYSPFEVQMGAGQVIAGFESALLNMKEGEEKNFTIPASQAYGEYNTSKLTLLPRIYVVPRIEEVDLSQFTQAYPNFTVGGNVTFSSWNATVMSITNDTVVLFHNPQVGAIIETIKWNETVVNVTNTEVYLRRDAEAGETYVDYVGGYPQLISVKDVTDEAVLVDYNHPLAGQSLHFYVKVISVENA